MNVIRALFAQAVLLLISPAYAAPFFVQIGAYEDAKSLDTAAVGDAGGITQQPGPNGLTRVRVGQFESLSAAEAAMRQLRASGYLDAFVTDEGGHSHQTVVPAASRVRNNGTQVGIDHHRINAARAKLPADQRNNVVYLDGRLMLKDGDTFRTLD